MRRIVIVAVATTVALWLGCGNSPSATDAGTGGGTGGSSGAGGGAGGGSGGGSISTDCDAGVISGQWDGSWSGCGVDVATYAPDAGRFSFTLKPVFVSLQPCTSTPAIDSYAIASGRPTAGLQLTTGSGTGSLIGFAVRCGSTGPDYLNAGDDVDGGTRGSATLRFSSAQLIASDGGREDYEVHGDLDVSFIRLVGDGGIQGHMSGAF